MAVQCYNYQSKGRNLGVCVPFLHLNCQFFFKLHKIQIFSNGFYFCVASYDALKLILSRIYLFVFKVDAKEGNK